MAKAIIDENVLICPSCGNDNLHHDHIDVFFRHKGEDSESYRLSVNAETGDSLLHGFDHAERNPSERRHGIKVWFWCEHCHSDVFMTIAQHKGLTLIEAGHIENGRHAESRKKGG